MSLFQQARFYTTANEWSQLPNLDSLEVAFAGRSNAGKSSAINTLANHTRLAFTSKTPGRTQHINYFELKNNRFLVDLPGYGYAEVPAAVREHWEKLLSRYLMHRRELIGLVLLMDARHPLKPLDVQMLDWFGYTGKPVHVLLTKADKLSRNEANATLLQVKSELDKRQNVTVQLFSSLKKTGVEQVNEVVSVWYTAAEALRPAVEGDAE